MADFKEVVEIRLLLRSAISGGSPVGSVENDGAGKSQIDERRYQCATNRVGNEFESDRKYDEKIDWNNENGIRSTVPELVVRHSNEHSHHYGPANNTRNMEIPEEVSSDTGWDP